MKEKLLEKFNSVSNATKVKAFAFGSSVGTLLTSIPAHAADSSMDPTVQSAISTGFTNAGTQLAVVIGLGVTATVGIIAMSGGAKAGLKWVKGAFSKAS
ncbi:hypothetical protein OD350_28170 [Clostridium beijerinckii]|uniref:hypothetical protein n=1 Tax=Clostridium TaxID=1485 RepID=UPI0022266F1D|nr:hypothetical protein [Clostridium beijerinckii]UYZ36004.1 hypothetical protein OD350_28170 [Clostridium beijerinckii]